MKIKAPAIKILGKIKTWNSSEGLGMVYKGEVKGPQPLAITALFNAPGGAELFVHSGVSENTTEIEFRAVGDKPISEVGLIVWNKLKSLVQAEEMLDEDKNSEEKSISQVIGETGWYARNTPMGKFASFITDLLPEEIFQEIDAYLNAVGLDIPNEGEAYYRDFKIKWEIPNRHLAVTANKYYNVAGGSIQHINLTPVTVLDIWLKGLGGKPEITISYYGAIDLAQSVKNHLVERSNLARMAQVNQQSGGINFGPINSAGDVNINLSHVAGRDQNTTTTSTTSTQQASPAAANSSNTHPSTMTPAQFNELLREQFNESELKDLCLALKIDYELLPGNSRADKTRELILYLQRRGRVPHLLTLLK